MRDDISVNGVTIDRFSFIADASVKIMAGIISDPQRMSRQCVGSPAVLAKQSVVNADALWEELGNQFIDDSETDFDKDNGSAIDHFRKCP